MSTSLIKVDCGSRLLSSADVIARGTGRPTLQKHCVTLIERSYTQLMCNH